MIAVLIALATLIFAAGLIMTGEKVSHSKPKRRRKRDRTRDHAGESHSGETHDYIEDDRAAMKAGGGSFGGAGATVAWTAAASDTPDLGGGFDGGGADGGGGDGGGD